MGPWLSRWHGMVLYRYQGRKKKNKEYKYSPAFTVVQDEKDLEILYHIKNFFKCGNVRYLKEKTWSYVIKDLTHPRTIVVPFFEKHPLQTKNQGNFLKFRDILFLIESKELSKKERFEQIRAIQETMNSGWKP